MTDSRYEILKSIAKGTNSISSNINTPEELQAKKQVEDSEQILNRIPTTVSASEKLKIWKRETREFVPHIDTVEYMWETEEKLSGKNFRKAVVNKIEDSLVSLNTNTQKTDFFKNSAPSWPKWLKEKYKNEINTSINIGIDRNVYLARINNTLNSEQIVNEFNIRKARPYNTTVAKRVHVEDITNAINLGYSNEIILDNTGRVSVPMNGELVPVHTIDQNNRSLEDDEYAFSTRSDNYKMIERMVTPYYEQDEARYQNNDMLTSEKLFQKMNELGSSFTPHHKNIILDYAEISDNPVNTISSGIETIVGKRIDEGAYTSTYDMALDYMNKWNDIQSTGMKRSKG